MREGVKGKVRRGGRSCEEWEGLILEASGSGLSVAAFCALHDVSVHSFYEWRRRLSGSRRSRQQGAFIPVVCEEAQGGEVRIASFFCVRRADGMSVEFPSGASSLELKLVISCL
jgi:hypothetical protein